MRRYHHRGLLVYHHYRRRVRIGVWIDRLGIEIPYSAGNPPPPESAPVIAVPPMATPPDMHVTFLKAVNFPSMPMSVVVIGKNWQ
ncbi:MAG: hypothetical protein WBQ69_02580 [Gallionella sp.]